MDVMKLRTTGFNEFNAKKREVQSALRDRRNTKLRDLIVVRVIKRIKQGTKRRMVEETKVNSQANRIYELNNLRKHANCKAEGSRSNRDIARESQPFEIKRASQYQDMILDKALEDIAKVEVDVFLNQGKILTDKHLKQVESSIKTKWQKQNINNLNKSQEGFHSNKQNRYYLPNYRKSSNKKGIISHTPKIGSSNSRIFIDHNYNTRNNYVNNGYSNERPKNYSRLNTSSYEKLPYGNNKAGSILSNSIMIDENKMMTPISSNSRSKPMMIK